MDRIKETRTPVWETRFRTISYVVFMAWAAVFLVFTPDYFKNSLDLITLILWLGSTFIGGALAMLGSVFRHDLRVELPGLILMLIGPGFLVIAQVWHVLHPYEGYPRYHLIALSLYIFIAQLPRIMKLQNERRTLKRLKRQHDTTTPLTNLQKAQPGAFPRQENDSQ